MYWAVWFIWRSWSFMGCDKGTGRWEARRRYFRRIIPATFDFVQKMKQP